MRITCARAIVNRQICYSTNRDDCHDRMVPRLNARLWSMIGINATDRATRAFITRAEVVFALHEKKKKEASQTRAIMELSRSASSAKYPGTIFHNLPMKNGPCPLRFLSSRHEAHCPPGYFLSLDLARLPRALINNVLTGKIVWVGGGRRSPSLARPKYIVRFVVVSTR